MNYNWNCELEKFGLELVELLIAALKLHGIQLEDNQKLLSYQASFRYKLWTRISSRHVRGGWERDFFFFLTHVAENSEIVPALTLPNPYLLYQTVLWVLGLSQTIL